MVTLEVAELISQNLKIPTIGIGSGPHCDGQVLVLHDMLNLYDKIKPKFIKSYTNLSEIIQKAIQNYIEDIKTNKFPEDSHSFKMQNSEYDQLVKPKKMRKQITSHNKRNKND